MEDRKVLLEIVELLLFDCWCEGVGCSETREKIHKARDLARKWQADSVEPFNKCSLNSEQSDMRTENDPREGIILEAK